MKLSEGSIFTLIALTLALMLIIVLLQDQDDQVVDRVMQSNVDEAEPETVNLHPNK